MALAHLSPTIHRRALEFGGFQAIVSSRLGEFVFVDPSGMKHFVVFPLFFDV
jgi:hypothetical protein